MIVGFGVLIADLMASASGLSRLIGSARKIVGLLVNLSGLLVLVS